VTDMTTTIETASRGLVARWRTAMALMGLGLGTTTAGFGWDYYVHEVVKQVTEVESMFAPPHLLIFAGFGITGLGFLWALARVRFSPGPSSA
jgi:predicted acyltransferase